VLGGIATSSSLSSSESASEPEDSSSMRGARWATTGTGACEMDVPFVAALDAAFSGAVRGEAAVSSQASTAFRCA
jgi:hypothetical protein